MSRSKWKMSFFRAKEFKDRYKTKRRNFIIEPQHLNKIIEIYNGQGYVKIFIAKEMIGHKLGEYAPTRRRFSAKKNKWDRKHIR